MRTPILAVVALVFGLAAAYGTWSYIASQKKEDPLVKVWVPAEDIPANTVLAKQWPTGPNKGKDMFVLKEIESSKLGDQRERMIRDEGDKSKGMDIDTLTNKRKSRVPLKKDKPIMLDADTDDIGAIGIQTKLKKGEQAVTVGTDLQRGGSGLLRPGMFVDVVCRYRDPNSQEEKVAVLYQDIEVLAINSIEGQPPENQPLNPDRVVLRMPNTQQAMRMTYFNGVGSITLLMPHRDPTEPRENIGKQVFDPKSDPLFDPIKVVKQQDTPAPAPAPDRGNPERQAQQKPVDEYEDIPATIYGADGGVIVSENRRKKATAGAAVGTTPAGSTPAPILGNEKDKKKEEEKKEPAKQPTGR
jgi:Flp pilus assembly protein CpaB